MSPTGECRPRPGRPTSSAMKAASSCSSSARYDGDRVALPAVGPQVLGLAPRVVGDDGVGGVEDGLGGAVVLVEHDHLGVGIVLLELQDVADVGAAPGVDALVGVADHAEVAVLGRQHRAPGGTGRGWCPGTRPPARSGSGPGSAPARRGRRPEQLDGHHQQVVEVHGRGLQQALLVEAVDVGHPLVVGPAPLGGEGLEVDQLVLGLADGGVERPWAGSAWGRGPGRARRTPRARRESRSS